MGKLSQKLVVYLDQNFISEMAKADVIKSVNPQFTKIYELLHKGFVDEKTTVSASLFHDIESSLIPNFKERISQYQAYLGQVDLHHKDTIFSFQVVAAAKHFLGQTTKDSTYSVAYHQDPDAVNHWFKVDVNLRMERWYSMEDRTKNAKAIDMAREYVRQNKVGYLEQYELELETARKFFLKYQSYKVGWVFSNDAKKIEEFVKSSYFSDIPIIDISSKMWAKILTQHTNRSIKTGDATDVDIVSAYLPYVDVLATDTFVANIIRDLQYDKKYKTLVFGARQNELGLFESYIDKYIQEHKPINRPVLSIFVLPDKKIREKDKCFSFFKDLGLQGLAKKKSCYVEMYAFDDGNMPKYSDPRVKLQVPFTGLQEITHIKIKKTAKIEDVVRICQERSRSDKFVLVDRFAKIPEDFVEQLIKASNDDKEKIMGYKIF